MGQPDGIKRVADLAPIEVPEQPVIAEVDLLATGLQAETRQTEILYQDVALVQINTATIIVLRGYGGNPAGRVRPDVSFSAPNPSILDLGKERDIRGQIVTHIDPDPMAASALVRIVAIKARVVPDLVPDPRLPSDGQIVHFHFPE